MANFDSEIFGLVFPGLHSSQKINAQNSRPELSAFLSNFTFLNPKFIHGDFLLMGETNFSSPRCESHDVRAPDKTQTSDLWSAMCIAETTFAMRCIFIAICTLTAEMHCDVGREGSMAARAMPRGGELRPPKFKWCRFAP